MAQVRAGEAIAEGFRFVGPATRQTFGAMVLQAGVFIITALMQGEHPPPYMGLLVALLRLPFSIMLVGAFVRLALGGGAAEDSGAVGPGGLQWTVLEWRLLAVRLIVGVIYVALGVGLLLLIGVGLGILMGAGLVPTLTASQITVDTIRGLLLGPLGVALAVLGLPALAIFLFFALKLSMVSVVTAAEGKLAIGRAWTLSSGVFWPLFAVALVGGCVSVGAGMLGGVIGGVAKAVFGGSAVSLGGAFGGGLGGVAAELFMIGALTFIYRSVTGAAGAARIDEVFV
jgi:hypothetical protein